MTMANRSLFTLLLALLLSANLSVPLVAAGQSDENGTAFTVAAMDSSGLASSSFDTDTDVSLSTAILWPAAVHRSVAGESLPASPYLLRASERPPARASPLRF